MSLPEYTASTYTVELLANQYKEAELRPIKKELVTDEEVNAVVSKVMPALYLGFFLLVIVLSGVMAQ